MKNNNRAIIMLIAAAYIGYLGVKLIKDCVMPDPGAERPENPVLFTIIGIAFIAVTIFIIVRTIKEMGEAKKEEEARQELEEKEEAQKASEESAGEGDVSAETEDKTENSQNAENIDNTEKKDAENTDEEPENASMSIADRIKRLSSDDEAEE